MLSFLRFGYLYLLAQGEFHSWGTWKRPSQTSSSGNPSRTVPAVKSFDNSRNIRRIHKYDKHFITVTFEIYTLSVFEGAKYIAFVNHGAVILDKGGLS